MSIATFPISTYYTLKHHSAFEFLGTFLKNLYICLIFVKIFLVAAFGTDPARIYFKSLHPCAKVALH